MQTVTFEEALENTAPQPVALICTIEPDNGINLAPAAWWTYLESDPPMIGFSMANESHTCALACSIPKLAICLPGEAIADEVLQCGSVSGRDVDKAKAFGIELTGGNIKYPVHSKLVYICSVVQRYNVGDCVFFVCSIDEILLDETQRHIYTMAKSDKLMPIR